VIKLTKHKNNLHVLATLHRTFGGQACKITFKIVIPCFLKDILID
jgi:hypothetical protein